jgi:hypothetical protein
MNKLGSITIKIPYKGPGNVIEEKPVDFNLFKTDGHYSLLPQLDTDGRRKANLPPELTFVVKDGRPQSLRGDLDGNFHVIERALKEFQSKGQEIN